MKKRTIKKWWHEYGRKESRDKYILSRFLQYFGHGREIDLQRLLKAVGAVWECPDSYSKYWVMKGFRQ